MLTIDAAVLDAIVAHARRDHPDEACGVVAGPVGSDEATRHIKMQNAARSMTCSPHSRSRLHKPRS